MRTYGMFHLSLTFLQSPLISWAFVAEHCPDSLHTLVLTPFLGCAGETYLHLLHHLYQSHSSTRQPLEYKAGLPPDLGINQAKGFFFKKKGKSLPRHSLDGHFPVD
jgi:hypothetical protein